MGDFATAFQFVQLDAVAGQPSAVWFGFGKLFLQFAVIIYFAFLGVYKQYLARLQTSFSLMSPGSKSITPTSLATTIMPPCVIR